MSFSEMYCKATQQEPEQGELTGTCSMCGKHTNTGFKKKFSGNFTSAEYISTGEVLCPECKIVSNNSNNLRRTMFILTENEFITFKKKEAKEQVFNLPNKPFYIYLTKTWQKIGWIMMNQVPNTGNTGVINFLIDYNIVRCTLNELKEYCDFIHELRQLKIPKIVLETGQLEMHHYKKIVAEYTREKARNIQKKLYGLAGDPVYDLALYIEE